MGFYPDTFRQRNTDFVNMSMCIPINGILDTKL